MSIANNTLRILNLMDINCMLDDHEKWLSSKRLEGCQADFTNCDLSTPDIHNLFLRRKNLTQVIFSGARMTGINLAGANLFAAQMVQTMLQNSFIEDARFDGANLERANLAYAQGSGANFMQAKLESAILGEAKFEAANFSGANLRDAILNGSNLTCSNLARADLQGAKLPRANLSYARLMEANFELTDCRDAAFTGAVLGGFSAPSARLNRQPGRFIPVMFSGSNPPTGGASFRSANMEGAIFMTSIIEYVCFCGADLRSTNFSGAKFKKIIYDNEIKCLGVVLEKCFGSPRFKRHLSDLEYIEELSQSDKLFDKLFYRFWSITSDCGRSIGLWAGLSLGICLFFSIMFLIIGKDGFNLSNGMDWGFNACLYYSVVTFSTLGYGDITPKTTLAAYIVMADVVLGYVMLGGLISLLADKIARRS